MKHIISFVVAVLARIAGDYITKLLNRHNAD